MAKHDYDFMCRKLMDEYACLNNPRERDARIGDMYRRNVAVLMKGFTGYVSVKLHDTTWMFANILLLLTDLCELLDLAGIRPEVSRIRGNLHHQNSHCRVVQTVFKPLFTALIEKRRVLVSGTEVEPYWTNGCVAPPDHMYKMIDSGCNGEEDALEASVPLSLLVKWAPVPVLRRVCHELNLPHNPREGRAGMINHLQMQPAGSMHNVFFVSEGKQQMTSEGKRRKASDGAQPKASEGNQHPKRRKVERSDRDNGRSANFPPPPLPRPEVLKLIHDYCEASNPENVEEDGCAVCGVLTLCKHLTALNSAELDLASLESTDSRCERSSEAEEIMSMPGPLLAKGCSGVCPTCFTALKKKIIPPKSLANGFWIGDVPPQLRDLSVAEQMLIARIRHNRCLIKVASGRSKMIANVVMHANPMPQIYNILPPPRKDFEEILAFIYIGSKPPTMEDYSRTPMIVRRNKVAQALQWLKLNHSDYGDLDISHQNLQEYPENGIPVQVFPKIVSEDEGNLSVVTMSMHDTDIEQGTEEGPCPFSVHGFTGEHYNTMSAQSMKAIAIKHLHAKGKVLGIGRPEIPESMYDNPQAYPQMFPWLFPYGFGGIGQSRHKSILSEFEQKKRLLMYHDKRFQTDPYFPMVAFNHSQMKSAVTGSFLLTQKDRFASVVDRLGKFNFQVNQQIIDHFLAGENVKPVTDDEKNCFALLKDLDHVGGHVDGSLTSKKFQRNEVWALTSFLGAPKWFVTISPADNRHPVCMYLAGTDVRFQPEIKSSKARNALTALNPVAAARFFHHMVQNTLEHLFQTRGMKDGLFGRVSGHYGTVEQQARATLHLHLLLWIDNGMSPQAIRDRLVSADEAFNTAMINYLERCHHGEFYAGSLEDVKNMNKTGVTSQPGVHAIYDFQDGQDRTSCVTPEDPTLTLPLAPPATCVAQKCTGCQDCESWMQQFRSTVDTLILNCNVHKCVNKRNRDDPKGSGHAVQSGPKGCINKYGECAARFPRAVVDETVVDPEDGHITMKHLEPSINTFSPEVTYASRCNTDVTSLLSGSALKAVIAYVADYVTKTQLKTYNILQTAMQILESNVDLLKHADPINGARKLVLKMVNALGTKMEIGSPMAAMYALGNPDHYTGHKFVPFYWRPFVSYVDKAWVDASQKNSTDPLEDERVNINKMGTFYYAKSVVHDYVHRPVKYEDIDLYRWTQCSGKTKRTKNGVKQVQAYVRLSMAHVGGDNLVFSPQEENQHNEDEDPDDPDEQDDHDLDGQEQRSAFDPDTLYHAEHPLFWSHYATYTPGRASTHVPNFLGGYLPRRDQGDYELYCRTMLTLFKPWRTGRNLRNDDDAWKTAFDNFGFTDRQRELMDNFNLRYECYDSRDEFHAQQKARGRNIQNDELSSHWLDDQDDLLGNGDDFPHNSNDATWASDDFVFMDVDEDGVSADAASIDALTDSIIDSAAFDDPCATSTIPKIAEMSASARPSSWWKAVLKKAKDDCIRAARTTLDCCTSSTVESVHSSCFDGVKILNASYFEANFQSNNAEDTKSTTDIAVQMNLNEDQERAFRIVTNHACSSPGAEQLRMYVGGMGGTGKSTLISAIHRFFEDRREAFKVMILAPTGSAAAVINGSTYHSVLGINPTATSSVREGQNEQRSLRDARERLRGVRYIIIDEVSMIACHEMYAISSRLAQIFDVHDVPFGGVNIIFCGDFAQLDPAKGSSLFSGSVSMLHHARQTVKEQVNTLGKIIWHQFTTVVILKENMRQRGQTDDDKKLRTALENMRYAACTPADMAFLKTRVVSRSNNLPNFRDPRVRNVSVITGWNVERDRINSRGAKRFADDIGVPLQHFYSIDTLTGKEGLLHLNEQQTLWNYPVSKTNHIPGRLSLCVGMPVIIRYNHATELCITKGQEGHVVGWTEKKGIYKQPVLDTVFVQLWNPAKNVQLPELPPNVVPIPSTSTRVTVRHPSRPLASIAIQRHQVSILPNFAMTDYSSQGKTRPINVVNLSNCKSHLAYYTALSRTASAAGTLILHRFEPHKITRGISGFLRQEFRELEMLNIITKERYNGSLPKNFNFALRNPLLRQFQIHKGTNYAPDWHNALRWGPGETRVKIQGFDASWITPHSFAILQQTSRKRKHENDVDSESVVRADLQETTALTPSGPLWDSVNWSCAYDSFLSIIHNLWLQDQTRWTKDLGEISECMKGLVEGFRNGMNIDLIRNALRMACHAQNPEEFRLGRVGTDVCVLIKTVLNKEKLAPSVYICPCCGVDYHLLYHELTEYTFPFQDVAHKGRRPFTINSVFNERISNLPSCERCYREGRIQPMLGPPPYRRFPNLLIVPLDISAEIDRKLRHANGAVVTFTLKGVLYSGHFHFISRFIDRDQVSWILDGQLGRMAQAGVDEEHLGTCRNKSALLAFYSKDCAGSV